jgi:methionyl-tRNA formyltransferase
MEVSETNTPEFVESVSREQLDILYVIGWSRIVHHDAIVAPKLGTIGYHPAPLPLMRGRAVIPWTILLGVERTASTLFWMDDDIDHGPIAAQEFFDVDPRETATTLYKKHMAALRLMLSGDRVILGSKQQDHAKATYCAKRTPADGEIDWSKPPEEIDRLIRAVTHPYPGAWTMIGGKKVTIWEATVE